MAFVATIAGVAREIQRGWAIAATANGRDTLTCAVVSMDASVRPDMDQAIVFEQDGTRIFGGVIQTPTESGLGGQSVTPITTRIDAIDNNALVDRRYVYETIPAGTLKAALQVVVTYLAPYGTTLDAAQVDGPALPELVYVRRKLSDVFVELFTLTGYLWEIDYTNVLRMRAPGSVSAPFNIATGDGNTVGDITVTKSRAAAGQVYANRVVVQAGTPEVPIVGQADDVPEQTAHGLWEIVIAAPNVFAQDVADALAAAYLVQRTVTPKTVTYTTYGSGLRPGMTQTIAVPERDLNNVFILSEVRLQPIGTRIRYTVVAQEGSVFQLGWRNLYQQWLSPLSQVTVAPAGAGAGRQAYFLGGSATAYVQTDTPQWIPVDGTLADPGMQVTINTAARGSTVATVTVRLRATAGNVTARLRNLTDGTTAGQSSTVTSTTFETRTFAVTLANGTKLYRLELFPSNADTDVAGVAYLE